MSKCYAYLRVSGRSQVEGDGFPRQLAAIEAWAAVHGFEVKRVFQEEGVTGEAAWENRPAFEEMIGVVLGNGVRTIVVENLTRLARSFVVQDAILTFLASKDITLISADTGANVTEDLREDPMKKAILQMQAVFSELEKNALVRKLREARQRKKLEEGWTEGRKPFGDRPGEAETLERMKELRAEGLSFAKIAETLEEEGLPTRTGKPWYAQTVRGILKREKETA